MAERRGAARCRVCRAPLPATPILHLPDMPGSAQGCPDATTLADDRGLDLILHQCPGCGLVQVAGRPVPYYREVIRAAAYSPAMKEFRLQQFADWTERYALRGKPLLEVGCGRGEYLSLLRQAGIDAHGTEWSPANLAACRAAGLPARRAFPCRPGQRLGDAPYAAFACFNFMEHWPTPVASLRAIADNLAPGGIGFVEVPNFDMILDKALYSEFIADHLSYFTSDTLHCTLQLAGFEILELGSVWQDYILSAVVRQRTPLDTRRLTEQQAQLRRQLIDFIGRFPSGSVAVWGAGHQALAAIALAGIAPGLRYVVDSAPFKQGRFTPATHLPIVAPERLKSDPVDAVIVMAAAYSDEVAGIIRRQHGLALTVAVLRDHGLELL